MATKKPKASKPRNLDKENVRIFIRMIQAMAAEPAIPRLLYPIGHQPHFLASVAVDELYKIAHRLGQTELDVKDDMSVVIALFFYRHAFGRGYAHAEREKMRRES
jgi:hypothetical protein